MTHLMLTHPHGYTTTYRTLSGHTALDYVNTLSDRLSARPIEWLYSVDNLVIWARMIGYLTTEETVALSVMPAHELLQQAVTLREAIYRIMLALRFEQVPSKRDFLTLNDFLQRNFDMMRLLPKHEGFAWVWSPSFTPEQVLGRVAWDTSQLLLSDAIHRLGACEACGWLFIDTSKNRSRRWCSMETCGNRAKVRRHRHRQSEELG